MKPFIALIFILMVACSSKSIAYNREQVATLLQQQSYPEVLQMVEATHETDRDNYLLDAAGYAAFQMSMPDQAAIYFGGALATNQSDALALLYLGLIERQQHSFKAALAHFKSLIVIKPGNGRYHKLAADCYADLKQPDSALSSLATAFAVASTDPSIGNAYAEALLEKKRFPLADSVLFFQRSQLPSNSLLLGTAIKSAYLQKKYRNVLPLIDSLLLTQNIGYAPLLYGLLSALQLKEYKAGIGYAEILQLAGYENEQVLYYTARAYAGLKRYGESNALLNQCIRKSISENIEAYYTELAENKIVQKNFNTAQRCFDTAKYFSGNPVILYRKALAYDAAKQESLARAAFAAFLKNAGKSDTAMVSYARQRIKTTVK